MILPQRHSHPSAWETVFAVRFRFSEYIGMKKGACRILGAASESPSASPVVAWQFCCAVRFHREDRGHDCCVLQLCRKIAALSVATEMIFNFVWCSVNAIPQILLHENFDNPGSAMQHGMALAETNNDVCRTGCRFASMPLWRRMPVETTQLERKGQVFTLS